MMKVDKIIYQVTLALLMCAGTVFAQGPSIFFTDLTSGPKTGGENNKGVYVTIYGQNLGASQGDSIVTVGAGTMDNCPVWGATWLWYQKITCQLGPTVSTGDIVVKVNGQSSNPVPFRVRSGNIYFVDINNGTDSNDGSYGHPWKTIVFAKNTVANGDTIYLRAGTWSGIDGVDGASSMVMTGHGGTSGAPKAMLGYPGETATIACVPRSSICYGITNRGGVAGWWVFGELDLGANYATQYIVDWENGGGGDGLRFIGNKIHGSFATAMVLQGSMNGNDVLGNDIYNYWSVAHGAGSGERGYGIYYGGYGTQQNVNILYNRMLNDQGPAGASTKGLQIYGHCPNDCPGIYDHFSNVTIANNQVWNNCMEGMAVGGTDGGTNPWEGGGTLYIHNNLIAGNGSCATIKGLTYSGLQIGDGYGGMQAKIWNNTFYMNAGGHIGGQGAGDIYIFKTPTESFDISNNIFFAQPAGQVYTNFIYEEAVNGTPAFSGKNNLFFSNGNSNAVAPNWVTNTVSAANPRFVAPALNIGTANFRLQADSPAINAGATLGLVTRDIAGTPRPQETAYDIGAYEFGDYDNPFPPPPPPPVPTATMSAAPASVAQGQSAVLSYGCSDCTSLAINGTTAPDLTGQMTVTPTATTIYNLVASGAGGSATATVTVTVTSSPPPPPPPPPPPIADLEVDKTHTGNFIQGQTGARYTITVSNAGGAATSGTVTVTDTLPSGLTATAISGTGWTCTLSALRCTRSNALAAGASYPVITVTVNVASNAPSSVTNTATVSGGGEQNTTNNTASDPTNIISVGPADLAITKTHTGNFTLGQAGARYSITVSNVGGEATSGTVTVTNTLPPGLTATAISGTGWTCTLSTLRCTRASALAAGAKYSVITVTVNVAGDAPSSATNTATVSGGGEENTTNDTASDLTTITSNRADLVVAKSHLGGFTQGLGGLYTMVVSNIGGVATSGVVTVTDALPAGLTATAISGNGWTCTFSTLRCTRSNALAPGASYSAITLTVNVSETAPASLVNTATVSGGGELNTANDMDSDLTDIISPSPAIQLTPDALQFTANVGDSVLLQTVQGRNLGGGTLGWTATVETDSGIGWLAVGPTSGVAPSTLAITANAAGLAPGTYTGRVILSAMPGTNAINSPRTLPVQLSLGTGPQIYDAGIVNAASYAADGVVSPGSIAALFGQNMVSGTASATGLPLPVNLLGTQVLVNGIPAPLIFVSSSQINFQMPFDISGQSVTVVVAANGVSSPANTTTVSVSAPGIFSATSNGAGQGAVLNEDGTPNSESNPAAVGSVISIYLTGMGGVFPPLQAGQPAGTGKYLNVTDLSPIVLIGGSQVPDVQFSGAAPGFAGLNQINVRIPAGTAPGAISLQVQAGERSSNTVTIAVQ